MARTPQEGPDLAALDVPEIYDRYCSLVFGLARRILMNTQEAEDVTHEVFVSLMTHSGYDVARGSIAAYLCTMARSRAIDRLRARKRVRLSVASHEPDDAHQSPGAGETVSLDESTAAVRAALLTLPPAQRQVLELAYFEGLSQTEVAQRLDRPLGTVKSWTRNALLQLRAALKGFEGP